MVCRRNYDMRSCTMERTVLFVSAILFLGVFIGTHHVMKFREKQFQLLQQLQIEIIDQLKDSAPKLKEISKKEAISELTAEITAEFMNELNDEFLPDKRQDNSIKLELKYMIRDAIQKNITRELRKLLKLDIIKAVKEVVEEGYYQEPKYPQNLCSSEKNLPPGQKVLAYTVFGTRAVYYEGIPIMLREAVASSLYHDWNIRIYHDALVTPKIIESYKDYPNLHFCDARKLPKYGDQTKILGKFWRNIPIADQTVDIFCSRDLDSALLSREEDAVRDWLKNKKLLHSMRDFPQHHVGILAGMWCFRPELNRKMGKDFVNTLLERAKTYKLKTDQPLLNEVLWDNINKNDVIQHGSHHCTFYNGTLPFPTQRLDNTEFVGCPGHVCSWKNMDKCPKECRPKNHLDWEYC